MFYHYTRMGIVFYLILYVKFSMHLLRLYKRCVIKFIPYYHILSKDNDKCIPIENAIIQRRYQNRVWKIVVRHYHFRDACTTFRVLWILVLIAVYVIFSYFLALRIIRYYEYATTLHVEETYVDKLPFPTVTICNQNKFRWVAYAFTSNTFS